MGTTAPRKNKMSVRPFSTLHKEQLLHQIPTGWVSLSNREHAQTTVTQDDESYSRVNRMVGIEVTGTNPSDSLVPRGKLAIPCVS